MFLQYPQSSFSIRDYAFDSRSKNIAHNWPFSHKTLQTCLQHDVKNMLPPFQSLESLRNNSSNEEIISPCNGNSKSNPELTLESRKSKKSHTHIQLGLGQTKSKKPKPVLGSSRKTETETTMGSSKICPVCKVFSSSSNTTLNAHIDRCHSGESTTMKWTADPEVVIKHRIKPRKMRLMADIYKSAAHCTVEELDARNGTCWANNSGFPDHEIEFQGEQENKKRILSQQNSRKTGTLTQKKAHVAKTWSLLSTKPSSERLKKHGIILQKGCEDPSDSCRVKGSDVRSKGSRSTMQVRRSSDNMFDSRERVIDVINDIERQQQHYHDTSDSPVSTVSNPSLTRSESDKFSTRSTTRNDEKDALVALTSSGDWRSKGQSQSQSQSQITSFKTDHQPWCCSKSVIRLMGKNLTVVNTDENKVNCGQFPKGFISQHPTFNPPNSLNNNALDATFQTGPAISMCGVGDGSGPKT
ncbi:hypothetical protein HanRHA438_Chr00c43g0857251 [Helianthus annuus]|nr:hypothetical protein HanRHA438_Chr00c43g0857251 [Helianthus annuus]